jgi:hypothetical protein
MRLRVILFGTLASTFALSAQPAKYSLVALYYTGLKQVDLGALHLSARDLGHESAEPILGFDLDLNEDGVLDHLLRGSCGATGSCSLWAIDGKTNMHIASLSGRPLIVHVAKINSWPVLSTYSHMSATSGIFSTYVYDGQRYQQVSSIMLYDHSVDDLVEELETVKTIGRPADDVRNGA